MISKDPLKYVKLLSIVAFLLLASVVISFFLINNSDYVEVSGEIIPVEYQIVSPKISGIIKHCFYKDGDIVRKGDILLETDSKEYKLAFDELSNKFELQNIKIKSLQGKLDYLIKDNFLFRKKMKKDELNLKLKLDKDIISQNDYEQEIYKLKVEELSKNQSVSSIENDLKESQKELVSISTEMESTTNKLDKCKVLSQIDGIVVDEDSRIKDGSFYNSGEVLQKVYANSDVYAELFITEKKVIKVENNQKVKLFIDAVPYTRYKTFSGKLISLKETKNTDNANGYIGKVLIEDPFFKMKKFNDIKTKKLLFGLKLKARIYTGKKSFIDYFIKNDD